MIGRQGPAEYREARIAVADIKIAEHLVVGAVFLDDKDDVLHASPDFSHPRIRSVAFRCAWQADIGSNLHRCVREHAIVGRRELQQACLLKLIDVLVRGAAGIRLATINGKLGCAALKIWAGRTLSIDDEDASATCARRHGAWVPASRNEPLDRVFVCAGNDDRERIDSAEGHKQAPVGEHGQTVGVEALSQRWSGERRRQGKPRFGIQLPAVSIHDSESIRIVFSGDELVRLAVEKQCGRFTDRRDARRHAQLGLGRRNGNELSIAGRRDPGVRTIGPD